MQRKSISKKTDDDNESVSSSVNSVPDSSSNVPDTSSGHSYGLSKQERSEEKLNIASKETTIVFRLRLLVFLVLLLAAVGVSVIVYFITSRSENEEYLNQFAGAAQKVADTFSEIAEDKLAAVSSLGVALVAHGIDNGNEWPFLTLTSFQQRASTALKQSGALYVHVNPIVNTDKREQWESWVSQEAPKWIEEGLQYQQQVGTFDFLGRNLTKEDNRLVHPPRQEDSWPMWYHDTEGETHVDIFKGPYLPTYQTSPVVYEGSDVNENILQSFRTEAPEVCFATNSVVISEFLISPAGGMDHEDQHTAIYSLLMSNNAQEIVEYEGDALSQAFFPIYDTFEEDRKPVAVMVAWLHWRNYFINILPRSLRGIYLVLGDSCGSSYTYAIEGTEVVNVGVGDLHDTRFDSERVSVNYESVKNIADGTRLGLPLNNDFCDITLDIYSSEQFRNLFVTSSPIIMTVAVAVIFVFTSLLFVAYDRLVEHRQRLVMKRAIETNAVVASLFPANVRERLISAHNQKLDAERSKYNAKGAFSSQNNRMKRYLNGVDDNEVSEGVIAELYPNCTVMFADIAGFTAWSSSREPAQVFILLQNVYQAFDRVAKRRKVFKVETIGDSYVAVCGLPEPMENHQTNMVRFAWDCMNRMNQTTKELEAVLGPDTGNLSMRFGLHSGPVTAGVLQGDRARFQLFGDTVNTAARMESTGLRGKIQVSQSTAQLLEASGKGTWLTKREEKVIAKGKGHLQTWWVNPANQKGSSSASGGSDKISASESNATSHVEEVMPKSVNPRLVSWIVELLLDDIKKLVHHRQLCGVKGFSSSLVYHRPEGSSLIDEVQDKIQMPRFDAKSADLLETHYQDISLGDKIEAELRQYVTTIAGMYRDNNFHNFEHACHVCLSTKKLLRRVVTPEMSQEDAANNSSSTSDMKVELANRLHHSTHGLTSDPLMSLALTFSALVHDVDHRGVSNQQLMNDCKDLADKYNNKSIAEQNSLDIAWNTLQQDEYRHLRSCIFATRSEMMRFRQLIVNLVLATDIFNKEINNARKARWRQAFAVKDNGGCENIQVDHDLIATIIIEHIIQASYVSHTMQHWHVYQKWNRCLFKELHRAYKQGRMAKDPATFWYQGELSFFDNYVIPLAKKLKECGVFGASGDEYLNYAQQNRAEWEERGEEILASFQKECWKEDAKLQRDLTTKT